VILGSTILSLNLVYKEEISLIWSGKLQIVLFALVIACAVINNLGSVASDIAIERDWVVVLGNGNSETLTRLYFTGNFKYSIATIMICFD